MTSPWEVVVVSSNFEHRQNVAGIISRLDLDPICVSTVEHCGEIVEAQNVGLVFCDRYLPDGDYQDILAKIALSANKSAKVVVMSGLMTPNEYQQARYCGVFDIISSPCRSTDVEWMIILAKRAERVQANPLRQVSHGAIPFRKFSAAGIT